MTEWFRVFGTNTTQPEPAALLEHLRGLGAEVEGHFRGDDQGWFRADLVLDPEDEPLRLERYLATEDGIRIELNTWAAWLEEADQYDLMVRMIQTTQLFTLHAPGDDGEGDVEQLCVTVCRFLARSTDGVYQVDHQGFFAADGTVLVRE